MELSQVVKVDFSGFSKAAADTKAIEHNLRNSTRALREMRAVALPGAQGSGGAGGAGGGFGGRGGGGGFGGSGNFYINRANIYVANANVVFQNARISSMPGAGVGPAGAKDKPGGSGVGLLATAAAADAFVWKAASLANPGAMERFNDAIADTTAVIGHQLIPVLNELTRIIRDVGDWLAQHPTASKAIAYGGVGLAALATGGVALSYGRQAASGLGWAARGIGSLFSGAGGGTTFSSADMAAGRAVVNAGDAGTVARAGGKGLGRFALPIGMALQAGQAGYDVYNQPTLGRAYELNGPGFGGMGLANDSLYQISQLAQRIVMNKDQRDNFNQRLADWRGAPGWKGTAIDVMAAPLQLQSRDWLRSHTGGSTSNASADAVKEAEALKASSWGAAARPASYSDVFGSVLQMRQAIASSAGNDPAERTANATERMADAMDKVNNAGGYTGGGSMSWNDILDEMKKQNGETPRGG